MDLYKQLCLEIRKAIFHIRITQKIFYQNSSTIVTLRIEIKWFHNTTASERIKKPFLFLYTYF